MPHCRPPITVAQAATELSVSQQRIRALIAAGRLRAVKFGSAWLIQPADLEAVRVRRPGRPKKSV